MHVTCYPNPCYPSPQAVWGGARGLLTPLVLADQLFGGAACAVAAAMAWAVKWAVGVCPPAAAAAAAATTAALRGIGAQASAVAELVWQRKEE